MLFIQAQRDALLKPLQSVTGIVERRHTLPILSNVLIEGNDDQLTFMATDLEIQITSRFTTPLDSNFSLTVSAKKLQDILRSLPDANTLSLDGDQSRLQIKAGKSRFNLQTLPSEDFPKLAAGAGAKCRLKLPQQLLKTLLSQVQYAMAQQDMRYYLNGLLLVATPDRLRLVATDGHRLSLASCALDAGMVEFPDNDAQHEVILPRKTVMELVKLLSATDDPVSLELGRTQVGITFDNIELVSKVIDGRFPDYTRVIPVNYQKHVVVDRATIQAAMQRAAILSNEKFRGVRMTLTENNLRIVCNNTEQEEAEEDLEIVYNGEPLEIGFNVTYLLDVLNNVNSDQVQLSFGDANASCLLSVPGVDDYCYVVMPMRI